MGLGTVPVALQRHATPTGTNQTLQALYAQFPDNLMRAQTLCALKPKAYAPKQTLKPEPSAQDPRNPTS